MSKNKSRDQEAVETALSHLVWNGVGITLRKHRSPVYTLLPPNAFNLVVLGTGKILPLYIYLFLNDVTGNVYDQVHLKGKIIIQKYYKTTVLACKNKIQM